MGFFYGSGSFTRFFVDGPLPDDYLVEFPQMILRYAFKNLDEDSDQERAVGWVNIMDMFDCRFANMEYLKEPCIAMSWRVDARKVPSKALRRYCREAEDRIKHDEELEYLPKGRREEIRAAIETKLLRRAIPGSNTYDVIWNLRTGIVLFGSTSNRLSDEFSEFFFNCFSLHLKTLFPYTIASRILEAEGMEADILEGLRPSAIAGGV